MEDKTVPFILVGLFSITDFPFQFIYSFSLFFYQTACHTLNMGGISIELKDKGLNEEVLNNGTNKKAD